MNNKLRGRKGFFYKNYSPSDINDYKRMYFTVSNAKKIDSCIFFINNMHKFIQNELIRKQEFEIIKNYLIMSLMNAADKVANTTGVYEAYLKKFKRAADKDIYFEKIKINHGKPEIDVFNEDGLELIKKIEGDVLYLDPPYNSRQYSSNYHILETISKLEKPEIRGLTGVRKDLFKSTFSSVNTAFESLKAIIENANFKYIVLSYSSEGIIKKDDISKLMNKYGDVEIVDKNYKAFKSNNNTNNNFVVEYLFMLKKRR